VAQNGGFAQQVGSYTWLWAEFGIDGNFARDPYWVEGTWKDALTAFLLPLDRQSAYFLAGRAQTPDSLLLQEGARPNDGYAAALLPGMGEPTNTPEPAREKVPESESNGTPPPAEESSCELPADAPPETNGATPHAENGEIPAATETPRIDTPAPFAIRWGMPQKLTWKDTDEIAYALIDAHPDQDPLKLSFPKLHKLIVELEDFGDEPDKSTESILEAIQMAWYEEVK
jgi:FeS assembly protein IscX